MLGFFLNPKPLCQPLPQEQGLAMILGNSILSVNEPYYQETKIYADLVYDEDSLVIKEIKKYDWDISMVLRIAYCESGLYPRAFNPETKAKELGITKWSSCGIFQVNSPECFKEESVLYNYKYNIEKAYEKYLSQGLGAWKNCQEKLSKGAK